MGKTLVDIYTDKNRGKYKGEFDTEIIYLSRFSSGIPEDLSSRMNDIIIITEAMVGHAPGSQMDEL